MLVRPRAFQRTVYRPVKVCQFELWHTSSPVAVGHDQTRQGYVVVAALGYWRAGAAALVFSRQSQLLARDSTYERSRRNSAHRSTSSTPGSITKTELGASDTERLSPTRPLPRRAGTARNGERRRSWL